MPIQYFHATAEAREGKAEVAKIIRGEPMANGDDQGNEWPYLTGYELSPDGADEYLDLKSKLDATLRKDGSPEDSPSAHLWIADEYFERGNRSMLSSRDRVLTVLMFEFALEGLYVKKRGGSEGKLLARVPKVVCNEGGVSADRLRSFLDEVFWVRSKAAHGVRSIRALEDRIQKADTSGLLVPALAFDPFLVNLREIVRLSIRFFLDKHTQGVPREATLEELDR